MGTCDNCKATEGQSFVEDDLSEAAKKGGLGKGLHPRQRCCRNKRRTWVGKFVAAADVACQPVEAHIV